MENIITIKKEYNSLDTLCDFLITASSFECLKEYDIWEQRTDANGLMEKCIVLKKSNMHAVKIFFIENDKVKTNHIIPNRVMQAYFGKSVKRHRNILEVIVGKIKDVVLAGAQQKTFEELEVIIKKAS